MSGLTNRAIMVVEDQFYLAMDVKSALESVGAEVIGPFSAAAAALRGLRQRMPDCAVLDVNLGEGASFEVARTLRAAGVPFLFFTGYDASGIPEEFAEVPRLEKPVESARLIEAVRACLEEE